MKLQEQIQEDLKKSILSKDNNKRDLLRVVIGEINRIGKELNNETILKIIRKMQENAIELKNFTEETILNEYLPKLLTYNELEKIISDIIKINNFTTIKDTGRIMQELKNKHASQYDGKIASEIIKGIIR